MEDTRSGSRCLEPLLRDFDSLCFTMPALSLCLGFMASILLNQGEAHGVARVVVVRVAAGVDVALVVAIAHIGTTQPHIETRD